MGPGPRMIRPTADRQGWFTEPLEGNARMVGRCLSCCAALGDVDAPAAPVKGNPGLSQTRGVYRSLSIRDDPAPSISEALDDPQRHRRQAEAPVQGRLQGPALRGSADRPGRFLVPTL